MHFDTSLSAILAAWGKPSDPAGWASLALGLLLIVAAVVPGGPEALRALLEVIGVADHRRRRRFVTIVGFTAAFLSLGYIALYLRGGPRLSEATTYFLQGRALSAGHFAWTVHEPLASYRVPLLLLRGTNTLGGVLPPGYPLLLAAAFKLGAPMIIGPLLAGGVVAATYLLARELLHGGELDERLVEGTARAAAGLSVLCAALRYHTADTSAHGAAAFALTMTLVCALRARRTGRGFALVGLTLGYLVATRPATALPAGVIVLAIAAGGPSPGRAFLRLVVGALPGIALLLAAHRAVTGSFFASPLEAWFSQSNGPPGCFRYGFGAGVGCVEAQGGFVEAAPKVGFGSIDALFVTGRRLAAHALDVANLEPLALLILAPLLRRGPHAAAARLVLLVIFGQVLLYFPYYVEGTAPGAGARFFADVLPLEHALIAVALVPALGAHARFGLARRALLVLGLSCAGFAVHAVRGHQALAASGTGRPAFEPDVAREGDVTHGLLYFDTDEGYNLAAVPDVIPSHGLVAARAHHDDHDRLLYDLLGHPGGIHRYTLEDGQPATPHWVPPPPRRDGADDVWRFESEAEWPALDQRGGWAARMRAEGSCASGGAALRVTPVAGDAATVRVALPIPRPLDARAVSVVPHMLRLGDKADVELTVTTRSPEKLPLAHWTWTQRPAGPHAGSAACESLPRQTLALEQLGPPKTSAPVLPDRNDAIGTNASPAATILDLTVTVRGGPIALDWLEVHVTR